MSDNETTGLDDFLYDDEDEPEILTLEDDSGEPLDCEVMDRLTVDDVPYIVLAPLDDEDSVMIYAEEEDGSLTPVEDEDVNEKVFDYFRAAWDDYEFCEAE